MDPMERARAFMRRTFGFREFRPGQQEILEAVFEGTDTLVIMPTGGGKSLCYQVPAFVRPGLVLVISPLIALMKDQVDRLRTLDLPALAVHSLMGVREQEEALQAIAAQEVKLVFVSPERLRNQRFSQALRQTRVVMVAVDEAHCISQWGHDFRPDYLRIAQTLRALGNPQVLALTATATDRVRSDIIRHLMVRPPRVFVTGYDRRNLFWEVQPVQGEKEKLSVVQERLARPSGAAIIYTATRKNVDRLVQTLNRDGLRAAGYHAGLDEGERSRVQERFMEGRGDLVVATNAFGMGIDRSDIRAVIHHTFPGSLEAYYQESGRAGRDGEPADCLLLYTAADRRLQEFFIEANYPPRETVLDIYDRLRRRPEDLLWLTYRQIGLLGGAAISEMVVASCLKILEEAGAVRRLHRQDNQAELYLQGDLSRLISTLPRRATKAGRLLQLLAERYGAEQLAQGVRFLPQDLTEIAGLSPEAVRRALSELAARPELTYIPPFRGRGLEVIKRVEPPELGIDFEALQLRKAHELAKLDQVMAYATTEGCRRGFLLRYFGETLRGDRCDACDTCRRGDSNLQTEAEARSDPILAVKLLSGVARLKGRYGQGMAVKVLSGSKDRTVFQSGLHRLSTYGLLRECTQEQVQAWIKELIATGCVAIRRLSAAGKQYPVLELTERGHGVMSGMETLRLSAVPARKVPAVEPRPVMPEARKEAFQRLRELRTRIATQERLPPYCIFHDRTLHEMAAGLPQTPRELLEVVGVGEVTLRKYGGDFLELLNRIREEMEDKGPDEGVSAEERSP